MLVLQREQALNTLRNLAGPADPEKARNEQPDTLRARYGVDSSLNALYIRSTDHRNERCSKQHVGTWRNMLAR